MEQQQAMSDEHRLKHFQLALSMVGVTANLMTCELIHHLAANIDEKGETFSVGDAMRLADAVQRKYNPQPASPIPHQPPIPADYDLNKLPPEIRELVKSGQIVIGGAGGVEEPAVTPPTNGEGLPIEEK